MSSRSDEVAGGVFLIGLATLFLTGFWFPGILFVIGFTVIARAWVSPKDRKELPGGIFMIGLGFIFWLGFNVGLVLLMIGIGVLAGALVKHSNNPEIEKSKRKNSEFV